MSSPKTEKVVLLEIFREGEELNADISKSANVLELLGFLRCYVLSLEEQILNDMEGREDYRLY